MKITIGFPVLNEEKRLRNGIETTINWLNENPVFEYEIIIADNGSTDKTSSIARELVEKYSFVHYVHTKSKGVGLALREIVNYDNENIHSDYAGYMDIDLSTDIKHLADVANILRTDSNVKIVNGSRIHRKSKVVGRKFIRELTSRGLNWILILLFGTKCSDSVCGFKFFKTEVVRELIEVSSDENGWFYLVELLLRAERRNIKLVVLPVVWTDDPANTTVNVGKLIKQYLSQTLRLYSEIVIKKRV